MILPEHKTKIICTIGPASRDRDVFRQMCLKGMTVARLNFSHGTFEQAARDIEMIKSVRKETKTPLSIIADLPGPKIRLGKLEEEPMLLKNGDRVTLTTRDTLGTEGLIPVRYKDLPKSVSLGGKIFLFDGFIQLKILSIEGTEIECEVLIGGEIFSNKGVNLPGARLFVENVSERDLEIVDFALEQGIRNFAVSFVADADDIKKVRAHAKSRGKDIYIIAKIERSEALENIDSILSEADGIMIARGDLGVQIDIEDVPVIQKKLILKANRMGKPVITATQMLVSMTNNIRPTRAETTDVANAILDGTDGVMLSEETAVGKYPAETIEMMSNIARSIENGRHEIGSAFNHKSFIIDCEKGNKMQIEDVVSLNAVEAAEKLEARYILTPTTSGSTARRISRFKPKSWTLAFTRKEETFRFLNFSYGVYPVLAEPDSDNWAEYITDELISHNLLDKGDIVVLTQGVKPGVVGGTDTVRIISV